VNLCAIKMEVVPNRRYIAVATEMRTNTIVQHANFITQNTSRIVIKHELSVLWNFNDIEIIQCSLFMARHRQNVSPAPNWIDTNVSKFWFVARIPLKVDKELQLHTRSSRQCYVSCCIAAVLFEPC